MKASAPGKIILFGEHAVVYGRAALAVPVSQVRAEVEVTESKRPGVWIEAPDVQLQAALTALPMDHPVAAAIHKVNRELGIDPSPDLTIRISSSIPVAAGLGSGAAVTVALIRALAGTLRREASDEQISSWAFEIEKLHHGTPSGIDNTVVTYGCPVFFIKGEPIVRLSVRRPFTVVIGDTGIPAPTKEAVADVRRLWETDKARWDRVFDEIEEISRAAREAIESGKPERLGALMDQNQLRLRELKVSSRELDALVEAARAAGALGAKLSGGGRGGNMIALAEPKAIPAVVQALQEAGARNVITTVVG